MDQTQMLVAPNNGRPGTWDWLFIVLLVACMGGAAYVGVLAYQEGAKTEATKRSGEAWLQWFTENAQRRGDEDYEPKACAAKSGTTWQECQSWLLGPDGPFHAQRNAYSDEQIRVTPACGGADRAVAGMVALERITPLPPGAAIPFTVAPLTPQDAIDQKVTVRVSVCNKDASAIRVGEGEF